MGGRDDDWFGGIGSGTRRDKGSGDGCFGAVLLVFIVAFVTLVCVGTMLVSVLT